MKVNSKNIAEIEHDGSTLTVTFQNGRRYNYAEVGSEVFDALASEATNPDGSVGRLFRNLVIGQYEYEEVTE